MCLVFKTSKGLKRLRKTNHIAHTVRVAGLTFSFQKVITSVAVVLIFIPPSSQVILAPQLPLTLSS